MRRYHVLTDLCEASMGHTVPKMVAYSRVRASWHRMTPSLVEGQLVVIVIEVERGVVFQKWRWTAIAVTLGLIFIVSLRKEWPMTFIAVRCPHCQSDQIVKRGKTARGTQRYLCQNTLCARGSFLLDYCNRGCLPEV